MHANELEAGIFSFYGSGLLTWKWYFLIPLCVAI